jgi:hypothetical protein
MFLFLFIFLKFEQFRIWAKYDFWTNLKLEYEQISNLNNSGIWTKFRI